MITGFLLDIYDSDISFAWDTNTKELDAFLDKLEATPEMRAAFYNNVGDEMIGAVTFSYGDSTDCMVIFREEPSNKIVAHELYHVAYRILKQRGIEDEEAWAYLIGHLTEMFYDLYLDNMEKETGERLTAIPLHEK